MRRLAYGSHPAPANPHQHPGLTVYRGQASGRQTICAFAGRNQREADVDRRLHKVLQRLVGAHGHQLSEPSAADLFRVVALHRERAL